MEAHFYDGLHLDRGCLAWGTNCWVVHERRHHLWTPALSGSERDVTRRIHPLASAQDWYARPTHSALEPAATPISQRVMLACVLWIGRSAQAFGTSPDWPRRSRVLHTTIRRRDARPFPCARPPRQKLRRAACPMLKPFPSVGAIERRYKTIAGRPPQ